MASRVELFEQIRRDWEFEGLSIHALARRHGVHRRTVRQALESPLPPARKRPEGRPAPKLGAWRDLIDSWLEADREAPRKRCRTACGARADELDGLCRPSYPQEHIWRPDLARRSRRLNGAR